MDMLAQDGAIWRTEFSARSRPLAAQWRRQRLAYRALATLWAPLLLSLLTLVVLRYSLIDIPGEFLLLLAPEVLWLIALGISYLADRPPLKTLARRLDEQFDLDERLASALELSEGATRNGTNARLLARLRLDALGVLQTYVEEDKHAFPVYPRTRRTNLIVAAAMVALSLVAAVVPSPFDAARAEQAALQGAIIGAADKVGALNREVVERPELAANEATTLQDQLSAAESRLRARPADRSEAVAALSQAQDQIRGLLPANAADVGAARAAAASSVTAASVAAGGLSPDDNGLLGAAEAAQTLDTLLGELSQPQTFAAAGNLDRAAAALTNSDPAIAKNLTDAATALRKDDINAADKSLQQVVKDFKQLAGRQQASDFINDTLTKLDESKQQIAQVGLPPAADGGAPQADPNRALGPVKSGGQAGGAATPQPGAGAGQPADSAAQPGANAGQQGGDNNNQPTQGGQIIPGNGPAGSGPRNDGNAQPGDVNPAGTGNGQAGTGNSPGIDSGTGEFEPVYVPGSPNQPSSGGPQDTIPGVAGDTGTDRPAGIRVGAGTNDGAKLPYNQVIGQYSDSAAAALDRSPLPSDAKDYVRDYFNSLQK